MGHPSRMLLGLFKPSAPEFWTLAAMFTRYLPDLRIEYLETLPLGVIQVQRMIAKPGSILVPRWPANAARNRSISPHTAARRTHRSR